MKIGHLEKQPAATPVANERKPAAGSSETAAAGAAPESSTHVQLSSAAQSGAAEGASSSSAEFDEAKVKRIADAIREGKFTVNPEAIADKLIANAQEVLGRSSH